MDAPPPSSVRQPERLDRGVRNLPPAIAAIFEMRFAQGLSTAEIGEALSRDPDLSTAFVERLLKDGFDQLAEGLGAVDEADRKELAQALMELRGGVPEAAPAPRRPEAVEDAPAKRRGMKRHAASKGRASKGGRANGAVPKGVEPAPAPGTNGDGGPPAQASRSSSGGPSPRVRRRLLAAGGAGVLLAAGAAAALTLTGGTDSGPGAQGDAFKPSATPAPAKRRAAPARPSRPAPSPPKHGVRRVTFKAVGRARSASASAGRHGRGVVTVRVRGLAPLPSSVYALWVYNSRKQARVLGWSREGTFTLARKLPPNARHYRFLDVSLQSRTDGKKHSGISLLRAPLGPLAP